MQWILNIWKFHFWNNLQEKNELFHNILIHWDAPVVILFLIIRRKYNYNSFKSRKTIWQ